MASAVPNEPAAMLVGGALDVGVPGDAGRLPGVALRPLHPWGPCGPAWFHEAGVSVERQWPRTPPADGVSRRRAPVVRTAQACSCRSARRRRVRRGESRERDDDGRCAHPRSRPAGPLADSPSGTSSSPCSSPRPATRSAGSRGEASSGASPGSCRRGDSAAAMPATARSVPCGCFYRPVPFAHDAHRPGRVALPHRTPRPGRRPHRRRAGLRTALAAAGRLALRGPVGLHGPVLPRPGPRAATCSPPAPTTSSPPPTAW